MLKLINVQQLRLGMYVHKFEGSWLQHPFWRTAFLLEDRKDLEAILASELRELWIDLERGCGPAAELVAEPGPAPEALSDPARTGSRRVRRRPCRARRPPYEPGAGAGAPHPAAKPRGRDLAVQRRAHGPGHRRQRRHAAGGGGDLLGDAQSGALVSIVRLKNRDDYTYMHSVAVCALMVALARQLGLDEAQTRDAAMGGLMHDLGKMMPLEVLNKPAA
jgi:HD-GYP domain-containing protein (c-di-GMP phosphodiesterase class II)